ncbi:MAG TPA: hypothetical protein VNC16_07105 [Solirubrobacterales bacterium]|jgi:hypothetical protein|nr:hypothetical protein [Solirubrobacterales bacterium]
MKNLKALSLLPVVAMALIAFASSASATTLEVKGVKQTGAVAIEGSIAAGNSLALKDTSGFTQNTCLLSNFKGSTETKTGTAVTGKLSSLTFGNCSRFTEVHKPGALEISWISGSTNGLIYSEEAQVTSGSPIGTLNCTTGATTTLGVFTGVAAGKATIHVLAVLNCGIIPSAKLEGTYTVTTEGLGVVE